MVVAALLIGIFVILAYEGIFVQLAGLQDVARDFKELVKERSRLGYQKKQVELLEKQVLSVKEYEGTLNKVFLAEEDLVEFIGAAERSARNAGVSLVIQSRVNARAGERGFAFSMLSEGGFQSIVQFIDQVQNLENVVLLENAAMRAVLGQGSRSQGEVPTGKVSLSLEIFVPFQ